MVRTHLSPLPGSFPFPIKAEFFKAAFPTPLWNFHQLLNVQYQIMFYEVSLLSAVNNRPPLLCSDDIIPPGAHHRGGGAGWEGGFLPGAGGTHHPLGQQESSKLSQEVPEAMCGGVVSQNAPSPAPPACVALIPCGCLWTHLIKLFLLARATADLSDM